MKHLIHNIEFVIKSERLDISPNMFRAVWHTSLDPILTISNSCDIELHVKKSAILIKSSPNVKHLKTTAKI